MGLIADGGKHRWRFMMGVDIVTELSTGILEGHPGQGEGDSHAWHTHDTGVLTHKKAAFPCVV